MRELSRFPQAVAVISVEAAEAAALRIAAKLADLGAIRAALGGELAELAVAEPLDEPALRALEQTLGVALPAAYRALAQHVGTAGAGPDGGLLGAGLPVPAQSGEENDAGLAPDAPRPLPQRPFLLTEAWQPLGDDDGAPRPLPFAATHPEAALHDGVMPLTDLGDGAFTFLVLTGPRAGEVWEDRSAEGGPVTPLSPLLPWYEGWLDELLVDGLMEGMRRAMPPGQTSPIHEQLERWGTLLDERTGRPGATAADLAAQALWKLVSGRLSEADALIARLERHVSGQDGELPLPDGAPESWLEDILEALTVWSLADDAAAALDRYPPGERLMTHRSWRIRRLLAKNVHAPALALSWLAGDGRIEVRCAVATNPGASVKVLREARTAATTLWAARVDHLEALFVLELLARHPAWPADDLASFAGFAAAWPQHHTAPWVARAVACNRSAGGELLSALAAHPHACVREAAARRRDLSATALLALARDPDPAVREAVAANPALPVSALAALATDAQERVRYQVALRADLPNELQLRLAGDLTTSVLLALGERPQLAAAAADLLELRPPVVLPGEAEELEFEEPYVAELRAPAPDGTGGTDETDQADDEADHADDEAASWSVSADPSGVPPLLAEIAPMWPRLRRPPADELLELAPMAALVTLVTARALAHPGYPSPLLAAEAIAAAAPTADELDDLLGRAAAEHPWPDEPTLRALADARYAPTRARLAARPDLPPELVTRLLEDPAAMVQRKLAERGAASVPAETLTRWAKDARAETRAAAGSCVHAPAALLTQLAADPEAFVRRAVAQNPSAPAALVESLANDADPAVRSAVTWRLEIGADLVAQLAQDADSEVRAWATWRAARDRALAG